MVKKIYADYAKERGIGEITPAVMDTARAELGLEGCERFRRARRRRAAVRIDARSASASATALRKRPKLSCSTRAASRSS